MAEIARQSGSLLSPVMLGAIAGSGTLPISVETFEAAIRADGKAVEGNLRGFRAGLAAARAKTAPVSVAPAKKHAGTDHRVARAGGAANAGSRAADRHRRHSPAGAVSKRVIRAALSRPARADCTGRRHKRRQRQAAQGDRAASRRAHVIRRCGARCRREDRAGAHGAHRQDRAARQRARAVRGL